MNTATANETSETETLVKRHQPWWRLLWVRILIAVALMWFTTGLFFWSQSRSAWAVFRVNGLADPPQQSSLQSFRHGSGLTSYLGEFLIQDRDVTTVLLLGTGVDDQWLVRLRRFPKLRQAAFDCGQIGPGLQNLAGLPDLKLIDVIGTQRTVTRSWIGHVDSTISAKHFLMVPQFETLALSGFKEAISDLDQLSQHPHLSDISLDDISRLGEVLQQIEACHNIKSLSIRSQQKFDEDSLASICKMSHLKTLIVDRVAKTEDVELQLQQSLPTTSIVWRPN